MTSIFILSCISKCFAFIIITYNSCITGGSTNQRWAFSRHNNEDDFVSRYDRMTDAGNDYSVFNSNLPGNINPDWEVVLNTNQSISIILIEKKGVTKGETHAHDIHMCRSFWFYLLVYKTSHSRQYWWKFSGLKPKAWVVLPLVVR